LPAACAGNRGALASTFNGLGTSLQLPVRGLGELAALLILVAGHALNLGLSVAGGSCTACASTSSGLHWSLTTRGIPSPFLRKEKRRTNS
jgi:V/A-type H+-transporting ATPase subunit I